MRVQIGTPPTLLNVNNDDNHDDNNDDNNDNDDDNDPPAAGRGDKRCATR
jgi:hypothetical protein